MTHLMYILVFACGISCTLFSSYIIEYLHGVNEAGNQRSVDAYIPFDEDLYVYNDLSNLKDSVPGTQLTRKDKSKTEDLEDDHEAVNTLQAAVQLCELGRMEKARKLFEHALAISPRHPDILTEYGEFLERSDDVTRANQLYTRALRYSPGHSRALQNRRRTQPLVEQSDLELLRRIDNKRMELAAIPQNSAALRRVKKEAYFQQIHHTVGIEGNTMTLSETRHVVETRMAVGGRSVVEHNEVLGLDAAIKFINTTLVHRIGDVTLQDLLDIHHRVLGHVDPQEAGKLRDTQVYVSEHVPPPPARLLPLLEGFVEWLNAPETLALHPIKYAALAHYKLVYIHPFADGNGRTSRLLMNLILMQAGYPPVIIRKQDRHVYYRALRLANEGDVRPFIRFIAHCAEKTLDVYVWATSEYVQKIAMSASEQAAAARREAAEYAFVREFSGEDDLVGFGTSEVIDVGEKDMPRHRRDESEQRGAGRELKCSIDEKMEHCVNIHKETDSITPMEHDTSGDEWSGLGGWKSWDINEYLSTSMKVGPKDAPSIIYVPENKGKRHDRTLERDEGYSSDKSEPVVAGADFPGASSSDKSKNHVTVET